ncbi:hypothetical protein KOW79_011898 [Hemibagrus wyckioides]|uniref:Uncharacterized protein n=1 Tax=Hemibagrus wyckioides TaxID=337641 RepID=A0A9D3NN28_9TELE|nr:hypothetical protein KOW79_011898 [Hemibagrus wyckioides]
MVGSAQPTLRREALTGKKKEKEDEKGKRKRTGGGYLPPPLRRGGGRRRGSRPSFPLPLCGRPGEGSRPSRAGASSLFFPDSFFLSLASRSSKTRDFFKPPYRGSDKDTLIIDTSTHIAPPVPPGYACLRVAIPADRRFPLLRWRRDDPLNLSILLSGGKETNQDSSVAASEEGRAQRRIPASRRWEMWRTEVRTLGAGRGLSPSDGGSARGRCEVGGKRLGSARSARGIQPDGLDRSSPPARACPPPPAPAVPRGRSGRRPAGVPRPPSGAFPPRRCAATGSGSARKGQGTKVARGLASASFTAPPRPDFAAYRRGRGRHSPPRPPPGPPSKGGGPVLDGAPPPPTRLSTGPDCPQSVARPRRAAQGGDRPTTRAPRVRGDAGHPTDPS